MKSHQTFNEILLDTAFYTMACDGNIAKEEIQLIKSYSEKFSDLGATEVENIINKNIVQLNKHGDMIINRFLRKMKNLNLSRAEQKALIDLVIRMIYSDEEVEYNEIRFFRHLKYNLGIVDDLILEVNPDAKELLGDEIFVNDFSQSSRNQHFLDKTNIVFSAITFS